jgi:peroxiredoxin
MRNLGFTVMIWLAACTTALAQAGDDTLLYDDFNGQQRSIESYAGDGKWLVVMIWAHDCHVCNMEVESYAQFHAAHKDETARVLGVSLDGQARKAEAEAFIERHDLPFPNLLGEPATTMLHYAMLTGAQFRGTPTILLYGPDGSLRAAQAGAVPVENIEAYIMRQDAAAAG